MKKKILLGSWITLSHPSITEIFANCKEIDYLVIDLEHSVISLFEVENLIRTLKSYKGKNKTNKNPNLTSLESSIEEKTGIKVFIRNKKNNAGQVTFEYKDLDQLNRLIMVIKANY